MSRASVLARGRAAAEAGMVDTCTIVRITATSTNPITGVVTATSPTTIYTGPCRVQERGGYPRDINTAPDQPQLAIARELQLPVATSADVRAGDRVTITASAHDPGLVGVVAWLRAQPAKSEATARRFHFEQVAD
jgi:hypothetical protein